MKERNEYRRDEYTMEGTRNMGGAVTQGEEGKSAKDSRVHRGGRWSTVTRCNGRN